MRQGDFASPLMRPLHVARPSSSLPIIPTQIFFFFFFFLRVTAMQRRVSRPLLLVSSFARCFHDDETKFADICSDVVNTAQFWSSCGSRAVQSGI